MNRPHPWLARPYRLAPGWAECPVCGRQVKLTGAGTLPVHFPKLSGPPRPGKPKCPRGGSTP